MQEISEADLANVPDGYEVIVRSSGYAIRKVAGSDAAGPRPTPSKPSARKLRRKAVRIARRLNRGAYSGQ